LVLLLEIHSSSVYIAPAGTPAQKAKSASNLTPATVNISDREPDKKTATLSSNKEFATAVEKKQAQQLSLPSPNNNQALDARTAKALGSYISTFNTTSQQTVSSSLTGIDFYA